MRRWILSLVIAQVAGCGKPGAGADTDTEGNGSTSADAGDPTAMCSLSALEECETRVLCDEITIDDRPAPDVYADSELCAMAALRDRTPGLLKYNDCAGSGCSGVTILILADGRGFADFSSFDAEVHQSMEGPPIPCELPEAAVLTACLDEFASECTWTQFTDCRPAEPICACP